MEQARQEPCGTHIGELIAPHEEWVMRLQEKDTEIQKLQQENEQLAMGQAVLVQEVERIQGAIDQARLNADPETETKLFNIIANIDNILGRYTTRSKAMLAGRPRF